MKAAAWPVLIATIAALAGVACSSTPPPLSEAELAALSPGTPAREIRILTLNVWSGLTYRGTFEIDRYPDEAERRYARLVARLRELDPDLIAIQEANPLPAYAERLASDLGCAVVHRVALGGIRVGPCGIPVNLREGGAVLAKEGSPLREIDRTVLAGSGFSGRVISCHTDEITQAVLVRAAVNGKILYLCATHLHSAPYRGPALDAVLAELLRELPADRAAEVRERLSEEIARREEEVARLAEFLAETLPKGAPVVLLGDFNTPPESGELDPLLAGGFTDAFRVVHPRAAGTTWDPARNRYAGREESPEDDYEELAFRLDRLPHRLDLVLVNRAIPAETIVDARVVLTPEDGGPVSDHYGVLVTLRW